jgi:hypothetical protein
MSSISPSMESRRYLATRKKETAERKKETESIR